MPRWPLAGTFWLRLPDATMTHSVLSSYSSPQSSNTISRWTPGKNRKCNSNPIWMLKAAHMGRVCGRKAGGSMSASTAAQGRRHFREDTSQPPHSTKTRHERLTVRETTPAPFLLPTSGQLSESRVDSGRLSRTQLGGTEGQRYSGGRAGRPETAQNIHRQHKSGFQGRGGLSPQPSQGPGRADRNP